MVSSGQKRGGAVGPTCYLTLAQREDSAVAED